MQIKVPDRELQHTTDQLTADMPGATLVIQQFAELVDSVPTLRNYHRGMMDRLVDATAEAIAGSLGRAAGDPATQIAATSLVDLFRIQLRAIRQLADGTLSPHAVQQHVSSEVRRAATAVDHGFAPDDLTWSRQNLKSEATYHKSAGQNDFTTMPDW